MRPIPCRRAIRNVGRARFAVDSLQLAAVWLAAAEKFPAGAARSSTSWLHTLYEPIRRRISLQIHVEALRVSWTSHRILLGTQVLYKLD